MNSRFSKNTHFVNEGRSEGGYVAKILLLVLLGIAFSGLELFIGGTRLAYAVPGVCLIAIAGIAASLSTYFRNATAPQASRASLWGVLTVLAFASFVLVRNRFSEIEYIARMQFFIMAGAVVVYLIFAFVLTGPQERKAFFYILMVLAVVQVLVGVVQFVERNAWMPLPWAQRRDFSSWRASGFFISPNNFAGYLSMIGVFAIAFTLWARIKMTERVLTAYVAILCAVGVAFSGSRGGYLAFTMGCAALLVLSLMVWSKLRPRQFAYIATGVLAGIAAIFSAGIALMFTSYTLKERVFAINDPENMRWLLWESGIKQWLIEPIWGTGGFSFLYYGRLFRAASVQNDPIHAHNDYVQLLAEYGLIGLGLFVVFLVIHLVVGMRTLRENVLTSQEAIQTTSTVIALNVGAIAAVVCVMVHAVVEFNMHIAVNAFVIAATFGILANGYRPVLLLDGESPPPRQGFNLFSARVLLPIACVALLFYAIPMIFPEYCSERARVALRDKQHAEGLTYAARGIVVAPENPDLHFYAGMLCRERGEADRTKGQEFFQAAIPHFAKAKEIFPYDSTLLTKFSETYSDLGNYPAAKKELDEAEKWDPQSSLVFLYQGYIEQDIGAFDDAQKHFEAARKLGGIGGTFAGAALKDLREIRKRNEEIDKDVFKVFQPEKKPQPKPSPAPMPSLP